MLDYKLHIEPYLRLQGAEPSNIDLLGDGNLMLHPFKSEIAAQVKKLKEVFSDEYPAFMNLSRPKEADAHKNYRKSIFDNVVKPFLGRITRQYQQISVVEDYEVEWPKIESETGTRSLKMLCESKTFAGETLETFFWANWVKNFELDPNAVAVLIPQAPANDTILPKLKAMWVGSGKVWQLRKGEFAVIESEEKAIVMDTFKRMKFEGKILFFFDHESYCIATQQTYDSSTKLGTWSITGAATVLTEQGEQFVFNPPLHYCEGLPLIVAGHTIAEIRDGGKYERMSSILEDALPHLKKALRRDEDKEIVVLHHSVPREWEYAPKPCPTCNGTGLEEEEKDGEITEVTCKTCKGGRFVDMRNGLGVYRLTSPSVDSFDDQMRTVTLPTPPMGRIDGDSNAVTTLRGEFAEEISLAYRALGMEHLNHIPIAQAGIAKRYDSKEGEMNLVTAGRAGGSSLAWLFHCAGAIVFGAVGNVKEQEPNVRTPLRLDVEGVEIIGERLTNAIKNNYTAEVIYSLTLKYLEVVAGKDSDEYRMYQLRKRIDPYWSLTPEKLNFEQTQTFTLMKRDSEAYRKKMQLIEMSKNFEMLVQEAIAKDENFWDKKPNEQRTALLAINADFVDMRTDNMDLQPARLGAAVNLQDSNQLKNTQPGT